MLNSVRSSSGCGTDDCGRTSARSRPSTMLSLHQRRQLLSDVRGVRSSAFVRERHAPIGLCSRTLRVKSELREVIGALQSEVEFEAVVSELGAVGSTVLAELPNGGGNGRPAPCRRLRISNLPRTPSAERCGFAHLRPRSRRLSRRLPEPAPSWRRLASGRTGSAGGRLASGGSVRAGWQLRWAATPRPRARVGREPDPRRAALR